MPAFAVLEPPGHADSARGHADRFIFLNEKFSYAAFLFGPLWMTWQRLWLELLAYLAGLAAIGAGLYALGMGGFAMFLVFTLIQLLLGLEAVSLVRWRRVRSGWRDRGVVIADDLDLAERRFFEDHFARRAARAAESGAAPGAPPPAPHHAEPQRPGIIGLFPEPGGAR